ncbi:MAG: glycosyltransferase, partial [Candidatus Bathyarchaeota archaeon]|nr:glycosyltransferase [Candidatus Bathyarchaeota archaeon]
MEMSSEKPKVSIIIPTYNSEGTLSECLKAVFNQSYPFYEVIIVDNFSNDGTVRIAEEFQVKILRQKCNPALARNIGIVNSTGKYMLFLDSDQILSTLVISECIEKCESEGAGMARIPEIFTGKGFWSSCSAVWKNYYIDIEKLNTIVDDITLGEPRFFLREHVTRVGMLDAR